MLYALYCEDKQDHLEVRKANRDAHLAYIEETGVVEMAGPLLTYHGEMCGSLIILNVETLDEAEQWALNDPYSIAGLFEGSRIKEWKKVIG